MPSSEPQQSAPVDAVASSLPSPSSADIASEDDLLPNDTADSSDTVSPSDPPQSISVEPVTKSDPPPSVGIASNDDALSDDSLPPKTEASPRQMPNNSDVLSDYESDLDAEAEETVKPVTSNPTDKEKDKSRLAREEAVEAANSKNEQTAARNAKLRKNVEKVLQAVGEKSGVFGYGQTARAKAEVFVEDTIAAGEIPEASQQIKLKSSAATAAKTLIASLTTIWEARAVPFVCKQLPEELSDLSGRTVASAAVGVLVAISLLPSLFSGGPSAPKQKTAEVQKIESETAALEKKLNRSRTSTYSSASRSPVFPPDDGPITPPKPPLRPSPPPPPVVATKPVPPPAPAPPVLPTPPVTPPQPEPNRIKEVTPEMTLSAVRKKLGTNSALVLSASFDSLYAEPTVALQVSKAFHSLPAGEQRRVAELALQACRGLKYERVTFTEEGSSRQVAQAGIDVDLEDETENLRAQVGSLIERSDMLAVQANQDEAQISSLNARIDEERSSFENERQTYEKSIASLRKENASLSDDLMEANDDIARIPDRMELEKRTLEAEENSSKMSSTVEMTSIQLADARKDEAVAQQTEADAIEKMKATVIEKNNAIKEAEARVMQIQKDAEARAEASIAQARKEAASVVQSGNEKVNATVVEKNSAIQEAESRVLQIQKEAEARAEASIAAAKKEAASVTKSAEDRVRVAQEQMAASEKMATTKLEESSKAYDAQLTEQRVANEKELQSLQSQFKLKMDILQKNADTELASYRKDTNNTIASLKKENKSLEDSLATERDNTAKSLERIEAKATKAEEKALKVREGLEKRITQLQARLTGSADSKAAEKGDSRSTESESTLKGFLQKEKEQSSQDISTTERDIVGNLDKVESKAVQSEESPSKEGGGLGNRFARLQAKWGGGDASKSVDNVPESDPVAP